MNVVNLCFSAEGYYSGQIYEENVTISEELYEKIKDKVVSMDVYIYGLDGKHSEVLGEIDVQPCEEKDIPKWWAESKCDGETFREQLYRICDDLNLDLNADEITVEDYIKSLDYQVEVTVMVKKSNKDKLIAYADSLK